MTIKFLYKLHVKIYSLILGQAKNFNVLFHIVKKFIKISSKLFYSNEKKKFQRKLIYKQLQSKIFFQNFSKFKKKKEKCILMTIKFLYKLHVKIYSLILGQAKNFNVLFHIVKKFIKISSKLFYSNEKKKFQRKIL